MAVDVGQRVSEYVLDRAGEGLRTVIVVGRDDFEVTYIRKDLKQQYSEEAFAEVVDAFRLENPFLAPELETRPVGERRAILHYHENACIIQLPYSDTETILISLSRDAGRDLVEFIEACRRIVKGDQ